MRNEAEVPSKLFVADTLSFPDDALADDFGGRANGEDADGEGVGHDGVTAHDGVRPDGAAFQDGYAPAEPDAGLNGDGVRGIQPVLGGGIQNRVHVAGPDADLIGKHTVVANRDGRAFVGTEIAVFHRGASADRNLASRIFHFNFSAQLCFAIAGYYRLYKKNYICCLVNFGLNASFEVKRMKDKEVNTTLGEPQYHEEWIRIYRGPELEPYYGYAFDLADRYFRVTPPGPVLDAGCGTGNHIRHLTQRGYDVVGIDYSAYAIASAQRNLDTLRSGQTVHLEVADLLKLPYQDDTFSRVLCWGVLMHIPSLEQAIAELCRVTAPGGRLVIGEANQNALQVKLTGLVRRVLRKPPRGDYHRTPAGIETWDGPPGNRIVARRANIRWLVNTFQSYGASCIGRHSGELTQIYADLNNRHLIRWVHLLNRIGYRWLRVPGVAATNILIFEKRCAPPASG